MKRFRLIALVLALGLLLVPLAASADSHETGPKPLTWLSYAMSQPGKGTALTQHIAKEGAKIYDGLMADGHIVTWGVGMPVNHQAAPLVPISSVPQTQVLPFHSGIAPLAQIKPARLSLSTLSANPPGTSSRPFQEALVA